MNEITVYFFATLRDYVGAKSLHMMLPANATVGDLKKMLIEQHPRMIPARDSIMAAINREYAGDEELIPAQAEIAFFPPVSGG